MLVKFKNAYLEKLFEGKAVKGKPKFSNDVIVKFKKAILKLQFADSVSDLKLQRGLNFEALKGNFKGYFSIRIDYHYRLILTFEANELNIEEIILVHDLTNHYQ